MSDPNHSADNSQSAANPSFWKRGLYWATTMMLLMIVGTIVSIVLEDLKAGVRDFNDSFVTDVERLQPSQLLHLFKTALFNYDKIEADNITKDIERVQSQLDREKIFETLMYKESTEPEMLSQLTKTLIRNGVLPTKPEILLRDLPIEPRLSVSPYEYRPGRFRALPSEIERARLAIASERVKKGTGIQPIRGAIYIVKTLSQSDANTITMAVIAFLIGGWVLASCGLNHPFAYLFCGPFIGIFVVYVFLQIMLLGGHLLGWLLPAPEATTGLSTLGSLFLETMVKDNEHHAVGRFAKMKDRCVDTVIDWIGRRFVR